MTKFATKQVEEVNARQRVDQLVIDGIAQLEAFENSLPGTTYESEFKTLLKYIEYAADGNNLPETKLRHLKRPKNDQIVEYEFKSKHLRIYAIKQPNRKLIILCGHKNSQESDISRFRELKKQYLNSLTA